MLCHMKAKYYKGDFTVDSRTGPYRNWIVGKFIEDGPRHTEDVEIKYWEYAAGATDHDFKSSETIEVTFILKDKALAEINGERSY